MAGSNVSLAKATPLEKANSMIERVTSYAVVEPSFLNSEGIFRQSGESTLIDTMYTKVYADPARLVIENEKDFIRFPHNVTGLLKRFVMADNLWSTEAAGILSNELNAKLNENRFDFDLKSVIEKLIEKNHLEEAKMLHSVLHMAYLVSEKADKNKMGPPNMFQSYAPWLVGMARGDDGLFLKLTTAAKPVTTQNIDALGIYKEGAAVYGQTFDQAYPPAAQKLEEDHANISKRVVKIPTTPMAMATSWFKGAIDWVTKIALPAVKDFFTEKIPSWFQQLTSAKEKSISISAPTPVKKTKPTWQSADTTDPVPRNDKVVMGSQVRGPLPEEPTMMPPPPLLPPVAEAKDMRPAGFIPNKMSSDEHSAVARAKIAGLKHFQELIKKGQDVMPKRDKPTKK